MTNDRPKDTGTMSLAIFFVGMLALIVLIAYRASTPPTPEQIEARIVAAKKSEEAKITVARRAEAEAVIQRRVEAWYDKVRISTEQVRSVLRDPDSAVFGEMMPGDDGMVCAPSTHAMGSAG